MQHSRILLGVNLLVVQTAELQPTGMCPCRGVDPHEEAEVVNLIDEGLHPTRELCVVRLGSTVSFALGSVPAVIDQDVAGWRKMTHGRARSA